MRQHPGIVRIEYPTPLEDCNPEHDNIDVFVTLDDGNELTFVVATPNNIFWCMENEGKDYFFGEPILFVKRLTEDNIRRAVEAMIAEEDGKWLSAYGSPSAEG